MLPASPNFSRIGREARILSIWDAPLPPKELQVMMGSYGLNLFTPDAVRETGRPLSLGMLEIKELIGS